MHEALDIFGRYLASRGLRLTPTREHLLHTVCRQRHPFGAEHLIENAALAGQAVSRATVYRNLPHLEAARIVERTHDDGLWTLAVATSGAVGGLVCVRCGRVISVSLTPVLRAAERICAAHGFTTTTSLQQLHGICRRCQDPTRLPEPGPRKPSRAR